MPASAFPLTLLALMGFRDPVDGELQVQTQTVQWGIRRLGLLVPRIGGLRIMFSLVPTFLAYLWMS